MRGAVKDKCLVVLAVVSGAVIAGAYVALYFPTDGQEDAQAVERGMDRAKTPPTDAEALEDEQLTGDANEAGYRWAERRGLTTAADCPSFSKAFQEGCEAFVTDQLR